MLNIVYKEYPIGPASSQDTKRIANLILTEHFDKVVCGNPRHPNPLVNKAMEIIEGLGFKPEEDYFLSEEEYVSLSDLEEKPSNKVRFFYTRTNTEKNHSITCLEIVAYPDMESGPVEPYIQVYPQNVIWNLADFLNGQMELGIEKTLPIPENQPI